MWAAAVAVNEMCVTKGGTGAAFGLGESAFLGSLVFSKMHLADVAARCQVRTRD